MFYKINILIQVLLGNTYCKHKGSYLEFNLMSFGCEHDTRATSLEEICIFFTIIYNKFLIANEICK
jgi:hypothetical protein